MIDIKPTKYIGILGATFGTGNLGVNALAESTIKCILHRWPDAVILFVCSGRTWGTDRLRIFDREIKIDKVPIRFCRNIFLSNHYCVILGLVFLSRWLPFKVVTKIIASANKAFGYIANIDMFCDITGGDSFSNIYGMKRFVLGYLRKRLCQSTGKYFVMLPQTYGPFKGKLTKIMARRILDKADNIYSRDIESIGTIHALIDKKREIKFSPDIAFILDACKPDNSIVEKLQEHKHRENVLIGLNVSGLLYNKGYTGRKEFSLRIDYKQLMYCVIQYFASQPNTQIILIPHVYPHEINNVESDPIACKDIYESIPEEWEKKVLFTEDTFSHNEIKYLIGLCDFFIGSRMHSCIAALSQHIPAIGIAYSKKFYGVFESVGVADCVADARIHYPDKILSLIKNKFRQKELIRQHLVETMPSIKQKIMSIFNDI